MCASGSLASEPKGHERIAIKFICAILRCSRRVVTWVTCSGTNRSMSRSREFTLCGRTHIGELMAGVQRRKDMFSADHLSAAKSVIKRNQGESKSVEP
jgi:hypothetical protein